MLAVGPIISLRVMSHQFVILNDYQAAIDLLEKRSGIYSSRVASLIFELYVRSIDDPA